VNLYPDVSVLAHGPWLPKALPEYDWVFTTKSFGVDDMRRLVGVERASFLPHAYDPEVHAPVALEPEDVGRYGCDVSFIGTWSPKKQALLESLAVRQPEVRLRIWGHQWKRARAKLGDRVEGRPVVGVEYAKALTASRVNLCILSEARRGASSGDRTTSRTFHIPATGAFMLHERTEELALFFEEGSECGAFGSPEELATRVGAYLADDAERTRVAEAGWQRSVRSGYSVDDRATELLRKVTELTQSGHRRPA
jgi:spore maturation protein CgeB